MLFAFCQARRIYVDVNYQSQLFTVRQSKLIVPLEIFQNSIVWKIEQIKKGGKMS